MKEKGKRVLEKLIDELNKKTEEPQQKKEKV